MCFKVLCVVNLRPKRVAKWTRTHPTAFPQVIFVALIIIMVWHTHTQLFPLLYAQLFLKFALPHIVLQCFTPFQGQAEVPHNEISPLGVSQVEFSALKASQALELDHNFKNKSRQESCSECRDISWRRMAGPEFENSKISTPPFCLENLGGSLKQSSAGGRHVLQERHV